MVVSELMTGSRRVKFLPMNDHIDCSKQLLVKPAGGIFSLGNSHSAQVGVPALASHATQGKLRHADGVLFRLTTEHA